MVGKRNLKIRSPIDQKGIKKKKKTARMKSLVDPQKKRSLNNKVVNLFRK